MVVDPDHFESYFSLITLRIRILLYEVQKPSCMHLTGTKHHWCWWWRRILAPSEVVGICKSSEKSLK